MKLTSAPTREGAHYWLKKGELLITRSNTPELVGHVAIYDGHPDKAICCDLIMKMRVEQNVAETRYIYYFLRTPEARAYITSRAKGASSTMKKIGKEVVQSIPVPLPPLAEQQRIVAILDEAFDAIATAKASTEKNLENAYSLFESRRETSLRSSGGGWISGRLASLCEIKHGFAFKSEYFAEDGEFVLLTPGNFYEAGGYRDRGEKQKYYKGGIPDGFILDSGALLVAMTEQAAGLLGSPLIVPEGGKFLHNQRLGLVVPKEGSPWYTGYFFHVFNAQYVRRAIHESGTGVKVRHTSPAKIGSVIVHYPECVSAQKEIAEMLDQLLACVQQAAQVYSRKLVALEELKKSLLHQAFAGQLTTRSAEESLEAVHV